MVATTAEIEAMEDFFKRQRLPKLFNINAAITIHDLPGFVQRTLENIKNPQVSDCVIGPRWVDLVRIKEHWVFDIL